MAQAKSKTGHLPAYKQIRQELVGEIEIRNPAPNSPYYSEKDIIERFKVSRVTVRQAMDLMEQDGYIYRVQGKGTFIGSLETKPTKTVAFVATCIMKNGVETVLLRSVEDYLNRQNYNLVVCNNNNDFVKTERYLRRLIKSHIDAIIYICVISDNEYAKNGQLVDFVLKNDVPCVLVDRTVETPGKNVFSVTADNYRGAYQMTEHLISIGHTRIGFCATADNSAMQERMSGYLNCLADHNIPLNKEYIQKMRSLDEYQVTAMHYIMMEDRPTAIFATNDQMAIMLMEGLASFNVKIPEDIAVVGFDDYSLTPLNPNTLTTMRVPLWEIGKLAASVVVDQLQGKEITPRAIRIPCELVVRESCGSKPVNRMPAGARALEMV